MDIIIIIYFSIVIIAAIHQYSLIFEMQDTMEKEGEYVSFFSLHLFSSTFKKFLKNFDFQNDIDKKQRYYRLYKRLKLGRIFVLLLVLLPISLIIIFPKGLDF